MRSTQLQTLRAVAAGASTIAHASERLGIPYSSTANRIASLAKHGYIEFYFLGQIRHHQLTDRARALLETRARLDGEAP